VLWNEKASHLDFQHSNWLTGGLRATPMMNLGRDGLLCSVLHAQCVPPCCTTATTTPRGRRRAGRGVDGLALASTPRWPWPTIAQINQVHHPSAANYRVLQSFLCEIMEAVQAVTRTRHSWKVTAECRAHTDTAGPITALSTCRVQLNHVFQQLLLCIHHPTPSPAAVPAALPAPRQPP
jgi:hypothetical protein